MHKVLNLLFEPLDIVALYSHTAESKKPVRELIGQADNITVTKNYFCINPLIEPEMGRVSANVRHITNFMFESDVLDLDYQVKAWTELSSHIPIRTLITSGGASVHAIISLAEPLDANVAKFRSMRSRILSLIKEHNIALANSLDNLTDMVRLSRTDGAYRPDTNTTQELLHTGPLMTSDYVNRLPQAEQVSFIRPKHHGVNSSISSAKKLEMYLKINIPYLHTFFCHAGIWAAPSGVYPEIFKNFLWLLEESKCPVDIAVELYNTRTVPELIAAGYPEEKATKSIQHAIHFFHSKETA